MFKSIIRSGVSGFAAGAGTALYFVALIEGACLVLKTANYVDKKIKSLKKEVKTDEENIFQFSIKN